MYRVSAATRRGSSTTRADPISASCGGGWRRWRSTRCANHQPFPVSSNPRTVLNCIAVSVSVREQMGIFALHDIPAGTELTCEFRRRIFCPFPSSRDFSFLRPPETPYSRLTCLADDYGWQDFSSIAPRPTTAVAAPPVDAAPHASTSAAVIDTSVTPSTPSAASASFPALTLIATGSNPSPASPPSSPLSSLSGTPPPRPAKTIAPLSPLGAHVDPARQRCYCGAQECSGFLGGRKKATACGKKGAAGSSGAAGAGATNAKAPTKRARDAYALRMQDGGRKVEFAPPKTAPKVVFVQAKVQASASTSSQSVAERVEKRGTSAGAVAKRLAGKKGKEPAVLEQVMGAMRSGREAAKKALGKLMGAPAPVFEEEEQ